MKKNLKVERYFNVNPHSCLFSTIMSSFKKHKLLITSWTRKTLKSSIGRTHNSFDRKLRHLFSKACVLLTRRRMIGSKMSSWSLKAQFQKNFLQTYIFYHQFEQDCWNYLLLLHLWYSIFLITLYVVTIWVCTWTENHGHHFSIHLPSFRSESRSCFINVMNKCEY